MSSGEPFRHIPDLELITWYAENNCSPFSSVSPWSKVVVLLLLVVIVTVTRSFPLLLILYAATAAACLLARLPMKKILLWYTLPAIFVLSLIGILAWGEPGTAVISFSVAGFTPTLTDAGLLLIGVLLLKALITVTYSLFFLMTTRYDHIAAMIDRIFPDPLNQIFLLSYRFLFLTIAMTGSLLKAVRSRGGGLIRSLRMQGRIFAQVFALTFIRSLDRAERVHAAMAARGYRGIYTTAGTVPRPSAAEIVFLVAAAICTAGIAITAGSFPAGGMP